MPRTRTAREPPQGVAVRSPSNTTRVPAARESVSSQIDNRTTTPQARYRTHAQPYTDENLQRDNARYSNARDDQYKDCSRQNSRIGILGNGCRSRSHNRRPEEEVRHRRLDERATRPSRRHSIMSQERDFEAVRMREQEQSTYDLWDGFPSLPRVHS